MIWNMALLLVVCGSPISSVQIAAHKQWMDDAQEQKDLLREALAASPAAKKQSKKLESATSALLALARREAQFWKGSGIAESQSFAQSALTLARRLQAAAKSNEKTKTLDALLAVGTCLPQLPRRPSREAMDCGVPLISLFQICQWLYDSSIGTAIRESEVVFPVIESIHVLAIVLLVGTVSILDLRLVGVLLKREPVSRIASSVLPWTWAGFAVMFLSGFLLFWAEAVKCYGNPAFRAKVILLVLVGLNPLIFHSTVYKRVAEWDTAARPPIRARLAGSLSLTLWVGIIITGRAIAYFKSAT